MLKKIFSQKEYKVVASNYGALLIIQAANFILPLLILPYLVRTLGEERYGIVMIAQSLAIFFIVLVDFGFNISATREVSLQREDKNKLSQLFWNVLFIKLLLTLIMFGALLLITFIFDRFQLDKWVYIYSFLMVVGQAIFPAWFFQGIERMKVVSIVNVSAKVIFTIAIFSFVLSPNDYEKVPLLNGGGFIIAGVFGLGYALKHIRFRKPQLPQMKDLLKQSSSLVVSNFATTLYTAGNTFILGMIGGDVAAGIYASMEKLVLACKNVFAPLYQALFPWLATKEDTQTRLFVKRAGRPIAFIALGITLLFVIFSKHILDFVYDNVDISSYHHALKIVGSIALFSALNMLLVSLYFPSKKAYKTRMKILVSGGVFNLVFAIIGAILYGIYGVAVAAATSELFILAIASYYYKNAHKNTGA